MNSGIFFFAKFWQKLVINKISHEKLHFLLRFILGMHFYSFPTLSFFSFSNNVSEKSGKNLKEERKDLKLPFQKLTNRIFLGF